MRLLGLTALFLILAGCASRPADEAARTLTVSEWRAGGGGRPPAVPPDPELLEQIHHAVDFRVRDDFDRFLDARDPGELLEHATLTQTALDRGIFELKDMFVFGDELFDYEYRPEQGLGNDLSRSRGVHAGSRPAPNLRRVHQGELGGPDSHGCAACHLKGGLDGAGNRTQNAFLRGDGNSTLAADERNPPHLLGLGPIAALAGEMTRDLERQRQEAVEAATRQGKDVEAILATKGVSFGSLTAHADGSVDAARVDGVDADLVVKPFGWKGHRATLQEMVEESFRIHVGVLSTRAQKDVRDGRAAAADHGDGPWYDVDRDGTSSELDAGMVTSMSAYFAQLEAPVIRPPADEALLERFARGRGLFDAVGCDSCHRPLLVLEDAVLKIRPLDPELADRPAIEVNVAQDGDQPKIEPQRLFGTSYNVALFSDLKRHDMGPDLATPSAQGGAAPGVFLTRPLWGLAFTSPYLHDGRAPTVDDAVRLHGGEAKPARDRYLALSPADRASLQVFLLSLDREPRLFVP